MSCSDPSPAYMQYVDSSMISAHDTAPVVDSLPPLSAVVGRLGSTVVGADVPGNVVDDGLVPSPSCPEPPVEPWSGPVLGPPSSSSSLASTSLGIAGPHAH